LSIELPAWEKRSQETESKEEEGYSYDLYRFHLVLPKIWKRERDHTFTRFKVITPFFLRLLRVDSLFSFYHFSWQYAIVFFDDWRIVP
jgi:hypothetical protein